MDEKIDSRKLSLDVLEEKRRQAHRLRKRGMRIAEIYWGDETGLRNDCQHERGYTPKGKIPVIRLNVKHESLNMISVVTNQGKARFGFLEGGMNSDRLIDCLWRLTKDGKRKVMLV